MREIFLPSRILLDTISAFFSSCAPHFAARRRFVAEKMNFKNSHLATSIEEISTGNLACVTPHFARFSVFALRLLLLVS